MKNEKDNENYDLEPLVLCCRKCKKWVSSSSAEKHRCKKSRKISLFPFDDDDDEPPKKKRKPKPKMSKNITGKKRKRYKNDEQLKKKRIIGEKERQMYNILVEMKRLSENK